MHPVIYSVTTPRLLIRCYHLSDAHALNQLVIANVEHLRQFMPWARASSYPLEGHVEAISHWIHNFEQTTDFVMGIFDRQSGELIGGTGLHRRVGEYGLEIGYWIDAAHTNKGLVTESTAALVKVAFDHYGMDRVEIHCSSLNHASARIPQKLGFQLEATLRRRYMDEYGIADRLIWTLFKADYPNSHTPLLDVRAYDDEGRQYL